MEKFAVDLDKVLDDFELEDEHEASSRYESLQLRFCQDSALPVPVGGMVSGSGFRHGGVFDRWRRPVESVEVEGMRPPGPRSPPDGQNDDGIHDVFQPTQVIVACDTQPLSAASNVMTAVTSHASLLFSDTRNQLPGAVTSTANAVAAMHLTGTDSAAKVVVCVTSNQTNESPAAVAFAPVCDLLNSTVDSRSPTVNVEQVPVTSAETGVNSLNLAQFEPSVSLDIIPTNHLDIVPIGCLAAGADAGRPDLIGAWQMELNREEWNSRNGQEINGRMGDEVNDRSGGENLIDREEEIRIEQEQIIEEEQPNGMEGHGMFLLPDLMSRDGCDRLDVVAGLDVPAPAIVTENSLTQGWNNNEPAIVMECQAAQCRLPEVANVHETTEWNGTSPSALFGERPEPHGEELHGANAIVHSVEPCDFVPTSCDLVETSQHNREAMPDVSVVNPVNLNCGSNSNTVNERPLSFSNVAFPEISDEDLEAELAELEAEQAILDGAYHGGVYTERLEDFPVAARVNISDTSTGPDLIEGVGNLRESGVVRELSVQFGETSQCSVSIDRMSPSVGSSHVGLVIPDIQELGLSHRLDESAITCGSSSIYEISEIAHTGCSGAPCESHVSSSEFVTNSVEETEADANNRLSEMENISENMAMEPDLVANTVSADGRDEDSGSGREEDSHDLTTCPDSTPTTDPKVHTSLELSDSVELGYIAPFWIPDTQAPVCQECQSKFTVIRRRHHCRACGRVLCAACCHARTALPYMEYREARVCEACLHEIQNDSTRGRGASSPSGGDHPDPNNPMDYCSRVPPLQQVTGAMASSPPTVMVPVGVLKREGNSVVRSRGGKQVMFSDGIRPGGDLTELDGADSGAIVTPFRRTGRMSRRVGDKPGGDTGTGSCINEDLLRSVPMDRCLIPADSGLPPVVVRSASSGEYIIEQFVDEATLEQRFRSSGLPVVYAIHKNLTVLVKIVKLECCVGMEVWNVATHGLCAVGQEELVVLLETQPGESGPPRDLFSFFFTVYQQASQGNLVSELSHTIFTEPDGYLGSRDHGGFLYMRPTFQCLRNLVLPPPPYMFAVLLQKWETPWAKIFPLRLMLRLGAEFRYYPCPLVSIRHRKPVFCEIGHTIMNLLVDFRNYTYSVPTIEGFLIHMEDKKTSLLFPRNRYEQVVKALSNSNDHVLALGANFSPHADSHLVTIENDDGHYSTQAINIHNRPRKVTGASFIVFNGALKTTCGVTAKSSIVEDGLMVQIPPDTMIKLRDCLRNMRDLEIPCGPSKGQLPAEEIVSIQWTTDDKNFNVGIVSPIDDRKMDGVPSVKIHSRTDYAGGEFVIRWTEVFVIQGDSNNSLDVNLSRVSENVSRAFCLALASHLAELHGSGCARVALRITLHQDNVGYEAGANGSRLASHCMNDLDTELIPVIHRAAANVIDAPIVLELLFHVMEQ